MIRSLAPILLLAFSVSACARQAPPPPQRSAAATAPTPQTAAPAQSPAPAQPATPAPQSETEQAAAAQESPGDTGDEEDRGLTRNDTSLERLAQLPPEQQLPAGRWKAGVNYDPLMPAQPTNVGPGKVEVVEVFWLGCPHCYAVEPYIQSWLKNKPDYIEFMRVPVMWGPVHRAHARLFYTLQALNRPDLITKAFDTIQQQHNMLVGASENETLATQAAFAKANGVSEDDFKKAYNSFTVNSNLTRAEQLTQRYHVEGVPLVVVNGKYTTDVGKAGSPSNLLALVNDLAAGEHRH
jgi:thiol:disulfide interchange protein DsbA